MPFIVRWPRIGSGEKDQHRIEKGLGQGAKEERTGSWAIFKMVSHRAKRFHDLSTNRPVGAGEVSHRTTCGTDNQTMLPGFIKWMGGRALEPVPGTSSRVIQTAEAPDAASRSLTPAESISRFEQTAMWPSKCDDQ